jgi:Resolvase, N terminal domain
MPGTPSWPNPRSSPQLERENGHRSKLRAIGISSEDQDLSLQIEKLKAAGCEIIRSEKRTGTSRESRRELETLLEFLRAADTLVVTRIDRLARSVAELFERSRTNPFRLKPQISRLTPHPQQARRFWTCLASSQNLRRACEKSGKWRGLPKRKPLALTRADGLRLTLAQS